MIPEAFTYHNPKINDQLKLLDQWQKDALASHEYTQQRMKNMIRASYQPFTKGQKVWLKGWNLSLSYNKKITTKREGPFKITKVLGPVNYRLKLPDKWKQNDTFHTSLLTPYKENAVHGPNYIQPPADLIDGQQEWEVE